VCSANVERVKMIAPGKEPASSFYRHKKGRLHVREISEVVVFSPNRGGTVIGRCRKYTVGCGAGRGGRPVEPFSLAEIAPVSW